MKWTWIGGERNTPHGTEPKLVRLDKKNKEAGGGFQYVFIVLSVRKPQHEWDANRWRTDHAPQCEAKPVELGKIRCRKNTADQNKYSFILTIGWSFIQGVQMLSSVIRVFGYSGIRVFGYSGIRVFGYSPNTRIPAYPNTRLPE